MSYVRQGLGFDALSLAKAAAPKPPATPLPSNVDPSTVEWVPKPDGSGQYYWRCKATGWAMSIRGCSSGATVTKSATQALKDQCAAAGYAPQVCQKIKDGDTMRDVQAYAKAWGARTTGEHRPEVLQAECVAAGVPYELLPLCVEARSAGTSMEEVLKQLAKLSKEELAALGVGQHAAEQTAAAAAAAQAARKSKLMKTTLLVGAGVGGLILLALWKKRKKQ